MTGPAGGSDESIAHRSLRHGRTGCTLVFFSFFLLAGLGVLALVGWSIVRTVVARVAWTEVPCEVLESRVESHPGDDGTTYSVAVRYRYAVDGRTYESDRYDFFQVSSSGYDGKARIVASLPPGSVAACRVDPDDPAEAVLSTGFRWAFLLILFPLPFLAVGAGGIAFVLFGGRGIGERIGARVLAKLPKASRARSERRPRGPEAARRARLAAWSSEVERSGPIVLEAKLSPFGKLVGVVLIAAIWNGITGFFVWEVWKSWAAGSPDGCLTIFILPFVLVGLLLLAGIPYQLLALFNPRPRLEIAPGRVTLGGSNELHWSFRGRAGRVRRLTIVLEGSEEADYHDGDGTTTGRETFATLPVTSVEGGGPGAATARGSTLLSVPADTMHSFDGMYHRIVWKLKIHGEIAGWPDVNEELPLTVDPAPVEGAP